MSELVLLDDHNADLGTEQTYLLEYGNTETVSGLGTFGAQMNSAKTDVELMFTPNADITTQVKVYMNAFRIQDDDKDQIEFDNGVIETFNGDYEGTERSIKRSFNLTTEITRSSTVVLKETILALLKHLKTPLLFQITSCNW